MFIGRDAGGFRGPLVFERARLRVFLLEPQSNITVAGLGPGLSACAHLISVLKIRGVWGSLFRSLVIIL